jgi:hypothetical protein
MSLKQNFCSSPWFHMRVRNNGGMSYCRWAGADPPQGWLQNQTPQDFFQTTMESVRNQLLTGGAPASCKSCRQMEQHGKVSGRQKQLLKTGIQIDQFEKTLFSSPWFPVFANDIKQMPQDWQVDLGNYCNSACVMCDPTSSSRLATEQLKLGMITELPMANWSDNSELVGKLISALLACPELRYIHFIGGETLITPAFGNILSELIKAEKTHNVTIGFTTNLTVWRQDIVDMLSQFASVNLGLSIEAFAPVNDYVRWPSDLESTAEIFERWIAHAAACSWYTQFRTTPTILSLPDLLTVYDMAWKHDIAVESCNLLQHPEYLRPSVLPLPMRKSIIDSMNTWLVNHSADNVKILNIRNPNFAKSQIVQDLQSYVTYLTNEPDESHRLSDLVCYLSRIESVRGNRVLDYRPEYEKIFRTAGYSR